MRAAHVVHGTASRLPFEFDRRDFPGKEGVVLPRCFADYRVWKARLMGQQLQDGDFSLPVCVKAGKVISNAICERKHPLFDKTPYQRRCKGLRARIKQPERAVIRRRRRLDSRFAVRSDERESAVACERNLASGIAPFGYMAPDERIKACQGLFGEAQLRRILYDWHQGSHNCRPLEIKWETRRSCEFRQAHELA